MVLFLLNICFAYARDVRTTSILHISSNLFMALGVFLLINMSYQVNDSNVPFQIAFLISALVPLYSFIKIMRPSTHKSQFFFALIGIVLCGFITFDIINNLYFFRDKLNSGFINPKEVEHDTPCSKENLIYINKAESHDAVNYRCPTEFANGLFIVIGNPFNAPLIPWPNYLYGKSEMIKREIHKKDQNTIIIPSKHIKKIIY